MASLWVASNPVFRHYAVCSGVLAIKVLSMALFTARQRITKMVVANQEDAKLFKTVVKTHPDVERVRRKPGFGSCPGLCPGLARIC